MIREIQKIYTYCVKLSVRRNETYLHSSGNLRHTVSVFTLPRPAFTKVLTENSPSSLEKTKVPSVFSIVLTVASSFSAKCGKATERASFFRKSAIAAYSPNKKS